MYVYRIGYKNQINSIFQHGFSRQFLGNNEGTDYGDGIYCNINIGDSLSRLQYTNGGCIFKCEITSGLDGYLIFDGKYASQTYGGDSSIKNQVYHLFGDDADKVWRDFTYIMKGDASAREHMNGRTAELLQVLLSPRRTGKLKSLLPPEDARRNVRKEYEMLFKKHNIKGAIYRGLKDGLCLVAYDFSECIPVAYSLDGGKTFIKKQFEGDAVDVQKKYGLKYKKIDYPITIECDGERYQFSRVWKNNGKVNYIDIQTGEEFSPIDFDSATLINKEDGSFQIEFNGKFYDACPDGFYDENDEGHTFDELKHFKMTEQELKFEKLLESTLNKVYKRFINENCYINDKSLMIENFYDEAKYGEFEIPSEKELDSNDMITVYHVTNSEVVDSIFKHEFDREFNCKNGNVYGKGVYSTISKNDSKHLLGSYGDAMIELKLIGGFKNFLIFNKQIAYKYYGSNCDILSQLKTFINDKDAEKLYHQFGNDVKGYSTIANKYNIRGAIYEWGGLTAVLPFDFSTVIPYSVSFDGGKTFVKKFNSNTLKRLHTSVDVEYRYGHLYKRVDKAIAGYNVDGEETGFSRVLKKNGKYNYIDIQTGEEVSPIDFDSVTLMNPEDGSFQIEYNGKFYDACLDGFYDENDEGHVFSDLKEL